MAASAAVPSYEDNLRAGMKTPETSKLFVRYTDPLSGVVSYMLKPGLVDENQQSLYFTVKSMTEDGRFIVFEVSKNEYSSFGVRKPAKDLEYRGRRLAVIDMMTETFVRFDDIGWQIPFVDIDTDEMYYVRYNRADRTKDMLCKRNLLADPRVEIPVCPMPPELTKAKRNLRYFTHLTLSHDRTLAYLDSRVDDNHQQGVMDIRTGAYTKWCDAGHTNINHGQINPVRNDIALNAWEAIPWRDSKGKVHDELRNWRKLHPGKPYPRLQLTEANGKTTMIPSRRFNYATHECWNAKGDGFLWCAGGGVWHHDLATGRQELISPKGGHAMISRDGNLVVSDCAVGVWWRGCAWQVYLHNRKTNRGCYPFTYRPPMCPQTPEQSRLHPDPHPHFGCGDRYILCTINNPDGHMDLAVVPVAPLVARTSRDPVAEIMKDMPASADPVAVGSKISELFLETPPDKYGPKGCERPFKSDSVHYSVVSLWVNALDFARSTKNAGMERRLLAEWEPFKDGGAKAHMRSRPYHVDFSIFGAVPYQVYIMTGDRKALSLGRMYAETQWKMPPEDYGKQLPKYKFKQNPPRELMEKYVKDGYSPHARLWIDDMYMMSLLQTQGFRAIQSVKYIDRMAKEAILYLDRLQLKEGPAAGLFHHAPDVPFVWGRGAGWMAGGLALILKHLPAQNPHYRKVLAGYQRMMEALLKHQRKDGLWGQLVDDPASWSETSGSAMYCCAFIEGVKNGWLDPDKYIPAARRAWIALCGKLDERGNIADVCAGTGKRNDYQYYLDRPRLKGDPHGQAPMLWCVNALLEPPKVEGLRP